MNTIERLAEVALRVEGHKTSAYGQGSYDGDFCKSCGWQGHPHSGKTHETDTRRAALIAGFTRVLEEDK